ncbi:nucleoside triphosphate pyrophosphohydrolase [Treponema ruminis]|uniref:Tetrapyrrole methylase family protein/MazG family protein n=1 Tax=Treponema ruminis TaxID=744515 RepID=A0A7W8G6S6_9SPIR|nr:nucleoside triphosphate pyrophosphohydrolase [Treponema ruminis]MBB5224789.1 tetrapyrrole methylase family protein/MazG family protein [Treponema ruminis]
MRENSFAHFFEIVKAVRKGCPWDKEQTPLSLRTTFFEETCEAIDAITQEDSAHVKEELGDVLLNVVLIAYLFEEKGLFTVDETIKAITEKLIRRHPHVFAQSEGKSQVTESVAGNPEKVLNQWERIKENVEGRKSESVLDSIPENFPPILKAFKMAKKASKAGFDWNSISEVKLKFCEELAEMHDAFIDVQQLHNYDGLHPLSVIPKTEEEKKAQDHLEEEYGDALMCFINYARWLGIDPSIALQKGMKKFESRFRFVEENMKNSNIDMDHKNHMDMMEFWNKAKQMQ